MCRILCSFESISQCKCLDPNYQGGAETTVCSKPGYKGDGNCDDENNVATCEYDGGDCCAKSVMKNGQKSGKVIENYCDKVGVERVVAPYYIRV